jgi:hypothetical protein
MLQKQIKTMNELAIKPQEFNQLSQEEVLEIEKAFEPMTTMLKALEEEYTTITKKEISESVCVEARELRLRVKKTRVLADKARKEGKSSYMIRANAIQRFYNIFLCAVEEKENSLLEIEKHYQIIEAKRKDALREERWNELTQYNFDPDSYKLDIMSEEEYQKLLCAAKIIQRTEEKKAEEKKAEEERQTMIENKRTSRKYMLLERWQFVSDEQKKLDFGIMSKEEFLEIREDAIKAERAYQKEQKKIKDENKRLRKEAEEQKKKQDALATALKKKEDEEAQRKQIDDAAEEQRLAEIKKRTEQVNRARFKEWLKECKYDSTIDICNKVGNKYILYRKIAEFTI